jgi:hypothetical protein
MLYILLIIVVYLIAITVFLGGAIQRLTDRIRQLEEKLYDKF